MERLNDYQAGIWVAPPSILRMLADARLAGRLAVQPHKLVGVAEVLDPLDRQIIERPSASRSIKPTSAQRGSLELPVIWGQCI